MEKIKKVFNLLLIISFLFQNAGFCISEKNSALRPPSHFNQGTKQFITKHNTSAVRKIEKDIETGIMFKRAMSLIQNINPALKSPEEVAKLHPNITAVEISLLAMIENIPRTFFEQGSNFEVIEIQEEGVMFDSNEGRQFVSWKPDYIAGINGLIETQRREYFSQQIDYIHGNDLSLAYDDSINMYEKEIWWASLEQRGHSLITLALEEEQRLFTARGYRSAQGNGNLIDIENNLFCHNNVSDKSTVMVLGLLEYFPKILAEQDFRQIGLEGRSGWYWYPKREGIIFAEKQPNGKVEFVPFAEDAGILSAKETICARLFELERLSRHRALNILDARVLALQATPFDRARSFTQNTNTKVVLVYDNYWVVKVISSQRNQALEEIPTHRFNLRDLYFIEQALRLLPAHIHSAGDIYYSYKSLDDSFKANRSFEIPDMYKEGSNFLITSLGKGKVARLKASVLNEDIREYLENINPEILEVIASLRTLLHEKGHRIWNNLPESKKKEYMKISWEWSKGKSEDAVQNPTKHFLFKYLSPSEDKDKEDFCDHFAAFILFGPQFNVAAKQDDTIAHKWRFFQQEIFRGDTLIGSENPGFLQIYTGLPTEEAIISEKTLFATIDTRGTRTEDTCL